MKIKYFVVDAFTDKVFGGNPAGVCLLESELAEREMQSIASENNLSETAFLVKQDSYYDLRWFTPEVEIDLCGHATIGSAFVLMNFVDPLMQSVIFRSKSGELSVTRSGDVYSMNFPSRKPFPCEAPEKLADALGIRILETHASRDLLVFAEDAKTVQEIKPDFVLLSKIPDCFGVIVTAAGVDCDFVSRYFAPNAGICEDPATGSSHCSLIPFWKERLGKEQMIARQLSARGGELFCRDLGDRVEIGGRAVLYLSGEINLVGA